MKKRLLVVSIMLVVLMHILKAQVTTVSIWPGVAPGSEKWTQKEVQYLSDKKQQMIRNVVSPSLSVYLPEKSKATGTAIIVAPGGGFRFLSWETEGTLVANWLAEHGIVAFVLKYRVMDTGATDEEFQKAMVGLFQEINAELNSSVSSKAEGSFHNSPAFIDAEMLGQEDALQSIRVVRTRASEWGIKPDRIGIMGFSAGGMITLRASTQFDSGSRPDFAAAIYAPWTGGTVPENAPPMFILAAGDDKIAAPGAIQTYNLWKTAGPEAERHLYAKGGHGFGMQKTGLPVDGWIERFGDWLKAHGWM